MKPFNFIEDQLLQISESLLFFHVGELKELAQRLGLSDQGTKLILVNRVIHFLKTGEKLRAIPFPQKSCAPRGQKTLLDPKAYMLYGSYKNDLDSRLFFKKLIGEFFHFTAFGIDWLNERWIQADPPTYQEFADMWVNEYARRKLEPQAPKQEWAYIRFVQNYLKSNPNASRDVLMNAWYLEREKHKKVVLKLLF